MKMNVELVVGAGRDAVWAAFDNPENMPRWQPTLQSFTPRSGTPGQPGAVSELVYLERNREVILTETITERRDPEFMAGIYDSKWGKSLVVSHFEVIDTDSTRMKVWSNVSFKGSMRLMSVFVAASIRKRNEADLQRFRIMVETDQANVSS